MSKPAHNQESKSAIATFAGGCFWCIESTFDQMDGIISAVAGYTDGKKSNPTYEEVCSGSTGHTEAVEVTFNPSKVTYEQILNVFWQNIDPTQKNGQFGDHGTQYRTAIFFHDDEQRKTAEQSKKNLERSGKFKSPIVVEIKPATTFYKAEDYHQDYYKKNPGHYQSYHYMSGRGPFIEKVWGKNK
ncbi:MAG: peptide-methionine (S)-S-oxide reductase MsrA [Candidatus Omnitrophica bacterium]|nr:peptide-methionine (S)-S-oxide reductase MsrA [Candidatus Omnitrophota bacterium]